MPGSCGRRGAGKTTPSPTKIRPQSPPILITRVLSQSFSSFPGPFRVCGTNPPGKRSSQTQTPASLTRHQRKLYILYTYPHYTYTYIYTHTLPAALSYSTTIYFALSTSLINLACQFKSFPFCCTDFFYYFLFFFQGKGYFPSCLQTGPDLAAPIPSTFSLGRMGPLKFFPRIVL